MNKPYVFIEMVFVRFLPMKPRALLSCVQIEFTVTKMDCESHSAFRGRVSIIKDQHVHKLALNNFRLQETQEYTHNTQEG